MLLQAAAEVLFTFQDARVDESSALVSTPSGDWLWTANDSGDAARVFAVDRSGRTLAVASLPGTQVTDVEDAALGPDRTLYLADIGDNRASRQSVTLLRVREPPVDPTRRNVALTTAPPVRTVLTYEDGPHDAETLLVHPRTGQVLVVTKGVLGGAVYAAPVPLADGVLHRVATVPLHVTGTPGGPRPGAVSQLLATGGAVCPDGRRLVVRTYTDAYVYEVPGDDLVAALRGTPTVLPLPATAQGEAVTWTRDGTALLTSSEGRGAPVHRVPVPAAPSRAAPAPTPSPAPAGSGTPAAAETATAAPAGTGTPAPAERDLNLALLLAGAALAALITALVARRGTRR